MEAEMNYVREANPSLVTCRCGNVMDIEVGNLDLKQTDENGKLITPEAAECMRKYRVCCNNCLKNFCANPACKS
jgi:hypothetical protein